MWFTQRQRQPEVQDQPGLDPSLLHRALKGLDRCNWWSGTAGVLWRPIRELMASTPAPLRVLDIGCGSGELLVQLGRRARRCGVELSLHGCDLNPKTLEYARAHARTAGVSARFFRFDACSDELPDDYDVILTSTFLHHLSDGDACALLSRMGESARRLVIVDDLIRCWSGWALAHLATRCLFTSWVNRVDGARSVAAAFSVDEIRRLATDAGLAGATVHTHWPARFMLSWQRTAETVDAKRAIVSPAEACL